MPFTAHLKQRTRKGEFNPAAVCMAARGLLDDLKTLGSSVTSLSQPPYSMVANAFIDVGADDFIQEPTQVGDDDGQKKR